MRRIGPLLSIFLGVALLGLPWANAVPAVPAATTEAAAAAAPPATFESVMRGAVPMGDLGTLLTPFAGKCDGEERALDRIRCQTTRAYLRRVIPHQSFWTIVDDPMAITVSEFDASIKGYHLSIAGCLACTRPVTLGRQKEARFVTLKAPDKGSASLRAAIEVGHNSVAFDNVAEARSWLAQSGTALRTQVVFQPSAAEWTFGAEHGYALKLLGMRVFNRCTGEILVSRPPSTGTIDTPGLDGGCRETSEGEEKTPPGGTRESDAATELSKNDIEQAMDIIRPQVFACFEKFKIPGMAPFDFVVAGNGTVSSVHLDGAFHGTPTGACLIEAAQNARFPRFARDRQRFAYPFFLRQ